jgi:hypothetical protein
MNSRQRVIAALAHQPADCVPVDLGSCVHTSISVEVIPRLREALGLSPRPVKVLDPYGMLGEVDEELIEALQLDVVGIWPPGTIFGFRNENWKPWNLPNGIQVLVGEKFNTCAKPDGRIYQYPGGDTTLAPSAVMPQGGFYFDSICRQKPIDENHLNVQDNLEDFQILSDADLDFYARETDRLYRNTDKAVMGQFPGVHFGDVGGLAAPWLKDPKGVRSTEEWYISLLTRQQYVLDVFAGQCDVAIKNLGLIHQAVGDKITVANICGNDFGNQKAPFIRRDIYRLLFQPFHRKLNDWIHTHTAWKTFLHTCGAIEPLLPDFIDSGFDILNPIQCSADGMDPLHLKTTYGRRICFWGGGVDTQKTLPFGTPDEVYNEVRGRLRIFNPGSGYIFNPTHCIQPGTPVKNILAMFQAVRDESQTPGV